MHVIFQEIYIKFNNIFYKCVGPFLHKSFDLFKILLSIKYIIFCVKHNYKFDKVEVVCVRHSRIMSILTFFERKSNTIC